MEYMIKRHRTHAETVLEQNGLKPKVMNEVEVAATMKKAGFGYSVWRKVTQCLKMYLGLERVCVPEARYRELGKDHSAISVGTYNFLRRRESVLKSVTTLQWMHWMS
jgi:hypothetical protein